MVKYTVRELVNLQPSSEQLCLAIGGPDEKADFSSWENAAAAQGCDFCLMELPWEKTTWDVIEAAIAAFSAACARYAQVHLLGFCYGGAIASYLAGHYASDGHIGKVALLSPTFAAIDRELATWHSLGDYGLGSLECIASPVWLLYGKDDDKIDKNVLQQAINRMKTVSCCAEIAELGHALPSYDRAVQAWK